MELDIVNGGKEQQNQFQRACLSERDGANVRGREGGKESERI